MKKALMAALLATALAVTPVIALGASSRPSYSDSGSDGGGSSSGPVNVVYGATASGAAASTSTTGQSQQLAQGPGAAPAVPQNYQPAAMPTGEHKSTAAPAVQSSESAPATGDWSYNTATGGWNFTSGGAQAKSQWVNASNPYANAGQAHNSWFYFDESGKMMTGWQWVDGKLYYFNEKADGTLGCSMANTTIDGKTLNAAGQWVVEGVVQTR
ncbi:MAG: hypothetical protein Q4D40_04500 [Eubacteriales bacterium]|nr:hypothetical protein [Eubacteriales bacterium]